jgi:PAS domain S-box-containing protein
MLNPLLPDIRVRQRDYLLEISRALTQELDLDILLERVLKNSMEMLTGFAGMITLRGSTGEWQISASHGLPNPFLQFIKNLLREIPAEALRPEDYELSEINTFLQELSRSGNIGAVSGVGLPLITRQQVVGALFVFRNYPSLFTPNDRALLNNFANQAAIAVQNAQLYQQINQEKTRLDGLLDSAADGILILNPDHQIRKCNPAFARMLNITSSEAQKKTHEDLIRWEKPPQDLTLEQAEAGGWPLTSRAQLYIEGDLVRGSGNPPLPVGITYAPLISEEGNLINIIATIRDITRFRQAEELKSTFISIISHELKTPVALIKGYASTLRREDAAWDRAVIDDSLAVIEEEADRLTGLIENLLDASRLQAGGLSLKQSDVLLPVLIKRIADRMQTQTSRHAIHVEMPEDFPVILADESRISQLITNLISNAIKYAPNGEIMITGILKPDVVVICVSDQGPGIAVEDIPHIFDRFYRAPDMARQTKGAGLGLFLSRAIVEAHNGNIWVDSGSTKGARICFSLPRSSEFDQ